MAKIKKDIIGLYVKSGGDVVRPSKNQTHPTIFKEGDEVKAYHQDGTTIHQLRDGNRNELWVSYSSMEGDIYDYAKKHYFKTTQEFEEWLKAHYENVIIEKIYNNDPKFEEYFQLYKKIGKEMRDKRIAKHKETEEKANAKIGIPIKLS